MDEFSLIDKYFARSKKIGDDAAIIKPRPGYELVISTDVMVEAVHFLKNDSAYDIGHKLVAVNLSDMAAMAAWPCYATLNLSLPKIDHDWLKGFSQGMFELADKYALELIGGDTGKADKYYLSMQIIGEVPVGEAISRYGAKAGDIIYVSGSLGSCAFALDKKLKGQIDCASQVMDKLNKPEPQIELGLKLRGIASSMIDISDGLVQDLAHLAEKSGLQARLDLNKIPVHPALEKLDLTTRYNLALGGGEEYELLFSVPAKKEEAIYKIASELGVTLSKIAIMRIADENDQSVRIDNANESLNLNTTGFKHFL